MAPKVWHEDCSGSLRSSKKRGAFSVCLAQYNEVIMRSCNRPSVQVKTCTDNTLFGVNNLFVWKPEKEPVKCVARFAYCHINNHILKLEEISKNSCKKTGMWENVIWLLLVPFYCDLLWSSYCKFWHLSTETGMCSFGVIVEWQICSSLS